MVQSVFAHFYCHGDSEEATRQMQLWVREVVSYQRHSVWLDVIEDQRKHESAQMKVAPTLLQKQQQEVERKKDELDVGIRSVPGSSKGW